MDQLMFPRFWKEKPALWFAQVEAVFALSGITSDRDRYGYTITELTSEAVGLVEDIILNPPVDEKYLHLKNELIKRISISYLEKEELGSKSPSEFLQYLRVKADHRVSEQTIKNLWLKSLPRHIKEIITIAATGSIEVLSEMADKIFGIIPGPVAQSSPPNENITECLSKLNVQLENLRSQLEKLQEAVQCQHCSPCLRCKSQLDTNNNKTLIQSPQKLSTCWYHTNFGDKAIRCIEPCAFKEKNVTQELLLNATSF